MSLILKVPTINDKPKDFDCLFQLWQQVQENVEEVIFDFSNCHFLRQNAVAFLGGLARLVESRGGKVTFDWGTVKKHICMNLKQNGAMIFFWWIQMSGIGIHTLMPVFHPVLIKLLIILPM